MTSKRALIICYLGPVSRCLPLHAIEHLGYEVVIEYIEHAKLGEAYSLSDITREYPQILKYRLADFDMIVIIVCEIPDLAENLIIPKEFIVDMKEKIKLAEREKLSPIHLVGINGWLSGRKLQRQAEVFEGLFIGKGMTLEQIQNFLLELDPE